MRITWTVKVEGFSGQAVQTRDDREAAQLVLKLFLAGVPRKRIIVDGKYLVDMGPNWVLETLGL